MVELRKRKAPAEPAPPPAPKKNSNPIKKAVDKVQKVVTSAPAPTKTSAGKLAVGDTIALEGFGGNVETHAGDKTNLKKLLDESKAGVVLFTYPRASTPGCEYPAPSQLSFYQFYPLLWLFESCLCALQITRCKSSMPNSVQTAS